MPGVDTQRGSVDTETDRRGGKRKKIPKYKLRREAWAHPSLTALRRNSPAGALISSPGTVREQISVV